MTTLLLSATFAGETAIDLGPFGVTVTKAFNHVTVLVSVNASLCKSNVLR